MVSHPLFSLGVDSTSSSVDGALAEITCRPLPDRGHVEYLAHHVRDTHTLSLEQAVYKMAGKPARRFGLDGRGVIDKGAFADVVVFDFLALNSNSTFETPPVYLEGIEAVIVNGTLVVDRGTHTGRPCWAHPGPTLTVVSEASTEDGIFSQLLFRLETSA